MKKQFPARSVSESSPRAGMVPRSLDGPQAAPGGSRRDTILAITASIALLAWPFFLHPGSIFYNRYFEAFTIFNPSFWIANDLHTWSYQFHLGYASLTELSYLSAVTLLMWAVHAIAGTEVLSKLYPAAIQAMSFLAFFWYARRRYPHLWIPATALVAIFYAASQYATGNVREGYSGMLIDFALFPIALAIVDIAEEKNKPTLVALIPLLYTLTSMFKYPEIAVSWIALIALRRETLWRFARESHQFRVAIIAALAVNAYWVFPTFFNLKVHTFSPIQTDTAGEVALNTQYASLTNTLLMRSYGLFAYNSGLCQACQYYQNPWFNIAMLSVAGFGIAALIRARRFTVLAVLLGSLIFATGFRYQDELIGIPYSILMSLPTFNIFRAAGAALSIATFCYGIGLLEHFSATLQRSSSSSHRRWTMLLVPGLSILIVCSPMLSGQMIDGRAPTNTGSFFVSIPNAYARLRETMRLLPRNEATLLLPNQPFANYIWGGTIQDFLPAYLGRPTISELYWPQPTAETQRALEDLTSPTTGFARKAGFERTLRIRYVVAHDDVVGATPVNTRAYGDPIFHAGPISLAHARLEPLPRFQYDDAPAYVTYNQPQVFAAYTNRITLYVPSSGAPTCPTVSPVGSADLLGPSRKGTAIVTSFHFPCRAVLPITVLVDLAHAKSVPTIYVGHTPSLRQAKPLHVTVTRTGSIARLEGHAIVGPDIFIFAIPREDNDDFLTFAVGSLHSSARVANTHVVANLFAILHPRLNDKILAFNESWDPVWQGWAFAHGRLQPLTKLTANGYANGWFLVPGAPLVLLNLEQAAFYLGVIVSVIAIAILVFSVRRARLTV